LEPDVSQVEVFVDDFHALELKTGKNSIIAPSGKFQPLVIGSHGPLFLKSQNIDDNKIFVKVVEDLYVTSISKPDGGQPRGIIRIMLTDGRHLWDRGFLDKWKFNIDDEPSQFLSGVVRKIISRLPSNNGISRMPKEWEKILPRYQFDDMGRPRRALRQILEDYNAEISYNTDTTVSFWNEGESQFGNEAIPIEDGFIEHADGNGHVIGKAFRYTPLLVTVVGGPRIATVGIDNWVPIIMLNGNPTPLREALVILLRAGTLLQEIKDDLILAFPKKISVSEREAAHRSPGVAGAQKAVHEAEKEFNLVVANPLSSFAAVALSKGELDLANESLEEAIRNQVIEDKFPAFIEDFGMKWLRRFVVRPDAWQTGMGLPKESLELLSSDAYRLWQIPGHADFNKHFLPMLPRAETGKAGKRLPAVAKIHMWHKTFNREIPNMELNKRARRLNSVLDEISKLGDIEIPVLELPVKALKKFFGITPPLFHDPFDPIGDEIVAVRHAIARMNPERRRIATFATNSARSRARTKKFAIDKGRPGLATSLTEAENALNSQREKINPLDVTRLSRELFNKLVIAEKLAQKGDNSGILAAEKIVREIEEKMKKRSRSRQFGEDPAHPEVYFFSNLPGRVEDSKTTIVDARLGIVRTSVLAGKLKVENVHDLSATEGIAIGGGAEGAHPLKVFFGTRVAPGLEGDVGGLKDVLEVDELPPQVRTAMGEGGDLHSTFSATFRITDGHVEQVKIPGALVRLRQEHWPRSHQKFKPSVPKN